MNLQPSVRLLCLDLNQNGPRWSGPGELVVWLIWIQAHGELRFVTSDCIWLRGLRNYRCFVRSAWEKSAAEMHQNSRRHKHRTGLFQVTRRPGGRKLAFFCISPLSFFLYSVCLSLSLLLAGGQSQESTGFSQRGFGSLFPRKQVRCRCHDNRHRSQQWSARAC